jgi:hypothetical protein
MATHNCSFCGRLSGDVAMARICRKCAKGRTGDAWCDFCGKTTITEFAWICRRCAKGRTGDTRCDFCGGIGPSEFARICHHCEK